MKLIELIDAKIEVRTNKDKSNELILSINQRIKHPYKSLEEQNENIGVKVKYFNLSNKRVLLVDDSSNNIREMLLLLKPYKVDVDTAKSFEDVRRYLSSNKTYDLIFVGDAIYGINLDDYSIKKYERLTGYNDFMGIIMLSNDNIEYINKYLEDGYKDYITKPINKKNTNEILRKYLKQINK